MTIQTVSNTSAQRKVVTVTLNPALDLTGSITALNVGAVSLVNQSSLHPAGKGVNVAKVLSDLGAQVTVTGFLGADNQEPFQQLFTQINANDHFVRVSGSTRINVKLVEDNGNVSDINFPGIFVNQQAIEQFEHTLFSLADDHDYFVIAGSLPQGISPQLCADWIKALRQRGKKVIFDSSREALKYGITSAPWLIKPNDEELSELTEQSLSTRSEYQQAANELAQSGIEHIVVSMGAKGVMWLHQNEWLLSAPPTMPIVSTVGAGDTLVAGLCWGDMQKMPRTERLSFATALSALAVSQVGVGISNLEELKNIQKQVTIQKQ